MKLLVIQTAALAYDLWEKHSSCDFWKKLNIKPAETVFPAVTCPVQASFRTGLEPSEHGIVANGHFDRNLRKTFFWEQSSRLIKGERIWEKARSQGAKVGQICWQQSLGVDSDLILSPAPIHKHHGGMIQDFYSRPPDLYKELCGKFGRKFNLFNYWGPFTSLKSSNWIADATIEVLKNPAPEILLTYIPHLDYDLQRYGPDDKRIEKAFRETELIIGKLFTAATQSAYEVVVFGDYAINKAETPVYPNKLLKEAGLFSVREVKGMQYPDLFSSKAFAMVDHQAAHVYVEDPEDIEKTVSVLKNANGIENVHNQEEGSFGELVLEASPGYWFAYPWWNSKKEAPDFATHVDIHSKPGFDPCELFMDLWPPMSVSQDASKIKGSHGLNKGSGTKVLLSSTFDCPKDKLVDFADYLKNIL